MNELLQRDFVDEFATLSPLEAIRLALLHYKNYQLSRYHDSLISYEELTKIFNSIDKALLGVSEIDSN